MLRLNEIYSILNNNFPFNEAEEWDNSGILVEGKSEVNKILVSLDATKEVVLEAIEKECDLIICHHPVIFDPIKALLDNIPAVLALKNNISIISAHTNYDVSSFGADEHFSTRLYEKCSFKCEGFLEITQNSPIPHGFGRIGRLGREYSEEEFASILKDIFGSEQIRLVKTGKNIEKVAFCCGGGSDYISLANKLGCDAYITSDVKHSGFIYAKNNCLSLFSPTHYQMEKAAMQNLYSLIKDNTDEVEVILSESECEPSCIL